MCVDVNIVIGALVDRHAHYVRAVARAHIKLFAFIFGNEGGGWNLSDSKNAEPMQTALRHAHTMPTGVNSNADGP